MNSSSDNISGQSSASNIFTRTNDFRSHYLPPTIKDTSTPFRILDRGVMNNNDNIEREISASLDFLSMCRNDSNDPDDLTPEKLAVRQLNIINIFKSGGRSSRSLLSRHVDTYEEIEKKKVKLEVETGEYVLEEEPNVNDSDSDEPLESKKHNELMNDSSLTCGICGKLNKSLIELKEHLEIHISETKLSLQNQMLQHYFSDNAQNEDSSKIFSIREESLRENRQFNVHEHNLRENREFNVHEHNMRENDVDMEPRNDADSAMQCPYCRNYFKQQFINGHMETCKSVGMFPEFSNGVGDQQSNFLNADIKDSYKYACNVCKKRFQTKQKLDRHLRIHVKKLISCEICASSFMNRDELDKHRLSLHKNDSAFACQECGKSFSTRQGLWEHVRVHLTGPLVYNCDICGKFFTSKQGFYIHQRMHNNERPYKCTHCTKCFRDGGTLKKHVRIHSGERPYSCPLCDKSFNQKVVLRDHLRGIHGKHKFAFDCDKCQTVLQDMEEWVIHMVRHSDEGKKKTQKAASTNLGKGRGKAKKELLIKEECLPGPSKYTCPLCRSDFFMEQELQEHIQHNHKQ